jgi:hypothetical protein
VQTTYDHTIGPLCAIGKAAGMHSGASSRYRERRAHRRAERDVGGREKGGRRRVSTLSSPRHLSSTLHPPPALCEIWLSEWAWGELRAERWSCPVAGELGAVVCWSCGLAKYCLRWTAPALATCRYCLDRLAARRTTPQQQRPRVPLKVASAFCHARLLGQLVVAAHIFPALDLA